MSTSVPAAIGGQVEHRDPLAAKLGMWLFLLTELILFGGLFLLYAVYRSTFPEDFHYGATTLNTFLGGTNTLILLTSSLTMVLSIAALERNQRKPAAAFLAVTVTLGLGFLGVKAFEWSAKIGHGLFPGSEELVGRTAGENIFFGIYYAMTGLHALHVTVGIIILAILLRSIVSRPARRTRLAVAPGGRLQVARDSGELLWQQPIDDQATQLEVALIYEENEEIANAQAVKLENAGLYWHLGDVIWSFLFPLLYLIT